MYVPGSSSYFDAQVPGLSDLLYVLCHDDIDCARLLWLGKICETIGCKCFSLFNLCVIRVLCHFQQSFSHITMVTACCMRHDSALVLKVVNTDALCRRHKTRAYHPVTFSRHLAIQSWFYPLNSERLARKQAVPILNAFSLARLVLEPVTCRLRGKCSNTQLVQI